MSIDLGFIHGINIGFEIIESIPEEEIPPTLIVDIFIIRLLISW